MSSTINQKQSFWKMVEAKLRSILVEESADSVTVLTAEDAASWANTLVLNALVLQDLLPDGSRLRSDGALKQWCITIAKCDVLTVARAMKEYQLFIRHYPDEWCFLSYDDFKHRHPFSFTGTFFAPVKDVMTSYLRDPHTADFKVLNQWISFPLKLTLKGIATNLTQKSELEYLQNEDRLANLTFDDTDIAAISQVLHGWFRGLTQVLEFHPCHSNGAVANRETRKGLYGKYCNMQTDHRIDYLYRKFSYRSSDYGFDRFMNVASHEEDATAKLITVPKGIDKRRLICPEPAEYQFNQQGIWRMLDDYVQNHQILRSHISIHDQSVNQDAALAASKYQDAATIDLSSASDSVSWELVKRVFSRTPFLLQCMWATRSTHIRLSDGSILRTRKYAPMGSALCFPIESILFAAICQVADNNTRVGRSRDTYHVYGDDIIVPLHAYDETVRLLTGCGFIINEQKTFYPYARFKESCGIEGLDGDDVTPIGISRKYSGLTLDKSRPELVSCYVSLANQLWLKGYARARTFIVRKILELPDGYVPPFSWSPSLGIASVRPTHWNALRRYNEDLQETEILVGCYSTIKDPDPFTSPEQLFRSKFGKWYHDIRYHETLRRLQETKRSSLSWPDDRISVSLCRSRLHLVSRWCPEWWFSSPLLIASTDTDQERLQFLLNVVEI